MEHEQLKKAVYAYWNSQPCGTEHTQQIVHSREFFEEIERIRYTNEPEIFSFAQFTRSYGKKILEVGVGAGTDFLQWVRAGAQAHGVDLTDQAIMTTRKRLELYGLQPAQLSVADAEALPYQDNQFDVTYSWGVIHHSPDTARCLSELIRVTRPGGQIKVMIYNRHSLFAFYRYLLSALFKGNPFRSLRTVLYHDQESLGTKAFTMHELRALVAKHPVKLVSLSAPVTRHDLLYYASWWKRLLAYLAACLFGWHRVGWFMLVQLEKLES